jgi:hypothetical protein
MEMDGMPLLAADEFAKESKSAGLGGSLKVKN